MTDGDGDARAGLMMALGAYGLWGLFPIYWKQVGQVPALEILAHRVGWSLVFVALLLAATTGLGRLLPLLRDPSTRRPLLLSTTLVALNWGVFIWAVNASRVTEASLGYYINPLVNVALGRAVLGERLRPAQWVAVAIAASAVLVLTVAQGGLPWVSLVLASSFGVYGLVRKRAEVGALDGLAIESGLAAPLAVVYLLSRDPPFGYLVTGDGTTIALLVGAGAATAIPLLCFAGAAKRLRYTTVGMVQYLAPTLQLACAVLLYGEAFPPERALAFAMIWTAIAIYVADALRQRRVAMA